MSLVEDVQGLTQGYATNGTTTDKELLDEMLLAWEWLGREIAQRRPQPEALEAPPPPTPEAVPAVDTGLREAAWYLARLHVRRLQSGQLAIVAGDEHHGAVAELRWSERIAGEAATTLAEALGMLHRVFVEAGVVTE